MLYLHQWNTTYSKTGIQIKRIIKYQTKMGSSIHTKMVGIMRQKFLWFKSKYKLAIHTLRPAFVLLNVLFFSSLILEFMWIINSNDQNRTNLLSGLSGVSDNTALCLPGRTQCTAIYVIPKSKSNFTNPSHLFKLSMTRQLSSFNPSIHSLKRLTCPVWRGLEPIPACTGQEAGWTIAHWDNTHRQTYSGSQSHLWEFPVQPINFFHCESNSLVQLSLMTSLTECKCK